MRNLLYAATAITALALAVPANATLVLTFGQNGSGNTITGTASGGTSTTISATDVSVDVTQILGGSPSTPDFLTLNAVSDGAAFPVGLGVGQHFDGTFSIRTATGGGGTNLLSGAFTDLLLGTGPAATITVGAPPDLAAFTRDVIALGQLGPPVAVAFSFANVTPPIGWTARRWRRSPRPCRAPSARNRSRHPSRVRLLWLVLVYSASAWSPAVAGISGG